MSVPALLLERWRLDPLLFLHDVLDERDQPRGFQRETLDALASPDSRRYLLIAPRGSGKSRLAAYALLWHHFTTVDSLGLLLAPTMRQIEEAVFAELRNLWHRSKLPALFPGTTVSDSGIYHDERPLWRVVGLSSDVASNLEGLHGAAGVFLVVDEGRAVADEFFSALMGSITDSRSSVLAISTAGAPSGWLYRGAHGSERYFWDERRILSAADVPWLQAAAERERKRLGDDDPTYRQQWLSDFAAASEHALFTPEILARAWDDDPDAREGFSVESRGVVHQWGGPTRWRTVGLDVARGGGAETVACFLVGRRVDRFTTLPPTGEMETATNALALCHTLRAREIVVDASGLGHAVADRLWTLAQRERLTVTEFNAGKRAHEPERYQNVKTGTALALRAAVLDGRFGLGPRNETLQNEMLGMKLTQDAKGKLRTVDPSRSPDHFDALLIAYSSLCAEERGVGLCSYTPEGWG